MRRRAVALPRRRVEHDRALVGRVRQHAGVVVGLRAADLDRAAVEVVVPQHAAEALARRLTGDEGVVVRLVLVRGHVHLVGLAVVDEHVPAAPVPEHLEVAGVLVDVEHDADVLLGDERLDVAHGRHEGDGRRVLGEQRLRRRSRRRESTTTGHVFASSASGLYHCRIWYMFTAPSAKYTATR